MNAVHLNLVDTTMKATFDYLMEADASFMLNRFSLDTSTITQTLPLTILPTIWGRQFRRKVFLPYFPC